MLVCGTDNSPVLPNDRPSPVTPAKRGWSVPVAVVALFGISLTSGYYAVRSASAARPDILTAEPQAHTFPDIRQGQVVRAEFRVTNGHTGPVRIDGVDTGCSCQAAEFTPGELPPGRSMAVGITWRMGGKRGRVTDVTWVRYADPAGRLQLLPLVLNAEVIPDVRCEPSRIEFVADRPAVVRVKLSPGGQAAFRVKGVYTGSRSLGATWEAETSEVSVHYTPADDERLGPGLAVQIETDSPNEPVIKLPVFLVPLEPAAPTGGQP